eukprot:1030152-Rhodomonas_salina.1
MCIRDRCVRVLSLRAAVSTRRVSRVEHVSPESASGGGSSLHITVSCQCQSESDSVTMPFQYGGCQRRACGCRLHRKPLSRLRLLTHRDSR